MPNYAVIDLGSNSVRLVVFEVGNDKKRSYTNKDFHVLVSDHEERLSKMLNVLLYGIGERGTQK